MSLDPGLEIIMKIVIAAIPLGVLIYTVISLNKGSKPNDEQ